jgi:hypothetical protein
MSENILDNDDPIEKKKKENENGGKKMNFKKFAITFFGHFFITICFFTVVIGACGLYTSKVAQSNILPFEPDFAPYTGTDYGMGSSTGEAAEEAAAVFMNIVKERGTKGLNFWDEPLSVTAQKATFLKEDFNDSKIFKFLCGMKPFTEKNEYFSRMMFFFRKIFISGVISSFGMVNSLYSILYLLPEWLLMLIYFTILPIIFIFLICWNAVQIFLEAVSNLTLPFRESNTKHNGNGISFEYIEPKKDDAGKIIDPTSEWWRPWSVCELNKYKSDNNGWFLGTITKIIDYTGNGLMFIVYAMITLYVIIPISFFVSIFGLTNPLFRKYKLDKDNDENKLHGIGDFIRDTFVYKKTFIIFLAAYNLLMSTSVYLEAGYTFSCFVGILILVLYFEVFIIDSIKINTDDITQQIFKNNEYSNMKQFKQNPNRNIFEPCKASTRTDDINNKTIVHRDIPKTRQEDEEVLNPLQGNSSNDNQSSYSNASIIKSPKPKSDFDVKAKIASAKGTFGELKNSAKKKIGEAKDSTGNALGEAKLSAQSLGRNAEKHVSDAYNKIKSSPDSVRNLLNPKSTYEPLDSQLEEKPQKFANNSPSDVYSPFRPNKKSTETNNTIQPDLTNLIVKNPMHSAIGGAKRNKNGALHKKYNFSLV